MWHTVLYLQFTIDRCDASVGHFALHNSCLLAFAHTRTCTSVRRVGASTSIYTPCCGSAKISAGTSARPQRGSSSSFPLSSSARTLCIKPGAPRYMCHVYCVVICVLCFVVYVDHNMRSCNHIFCFNSSLTNTPMVSFSHARSTCSSTVRTTWRNLCGSQVCLTSLQYSVRLCVIAFCCC